METIGEVKNIKMEHEIEWKILYFSSLSDENSKSYSSPTFSFCNESWCLRLYPNGDDKSSVGYLSLFLRRKSSGSPIKIEYSLGLKTLSGQKHSEKQRMRIFNEAEGYGFPEVLLRSQLFEMKADLLPADVITLFCSLKSTSFATPDICTAEKNSKEKCSLCGKTVDQDNLSVHQKKDKTVKCADCSAVLTLQDLCDHKCQVEETDCKSITALDNSSLSEDFKKMLQDGISHDIILKIGDKEIRAHKDVLRARSQVFKSMLEHDMKEKNSGVIDVSDCDPEAMVVFLSYVYSGKVDALDQDNMLQLYYIADKYQMIDLKNECCSFIKKFLSPTNFCDVIQLALNHSDSGLCDFATGYFICNVLDILQTVEWQSFMKDNSTVANELFIKSHKSKK